LAEVTQDTTMTLEEQVDAINEIAGAYGIQVTALDVLSGRYETLAEEMHAAMAAEQQEITAELEEIHVKQQDNVQKHVDVLAQKNTSLWVRVGQWIQTAALRIAAFGQRVKAVFLDVLAWINDLRGGFLSFKANLLRGLAGVVQKILSVPETVANAIIDMRNAIVDALASIEIFGWHPFGQGSHWEHVTWADDAAAGMMAAADAADQAAQAAHELAAA